MEIHDFVNANSPDPILPTNGVTKKKRRRDSSLATQDDGHAMYYIINFHHLGKSGSLVVCISPFSTIMMDWKVKLSALGWDVEIVGESKTDKAAFDRVINGEVQLVYISPENIINKSVYRKMLLTHIQGEFGWSCSRRSPLC